MKGGLNIGGGGLNSVRCEDGDSNDAWRMSRQILRVVRD